MSSGLSANTQDRKARLAALKSLKRKQPADDGDSTTTTTTAAAAEETPQDATPAPDVSALLLSGRNYDAATRAPKLGFEADPSASEHTLERRAEALAGSARAQAERDAAQDAPLDLFKLQPRRPNWDLKRDLDRKLEVLNVRTDNAVARLVRERIGARQREEEKGGAGRGKEGEGEGVGMEGAELLEATHLREKEDEEDARREREADDDDGDDLLDGS